MRSLWVGLSVISFAETSKGCHFYLSRIKTIMTIQINMNAKLGDLALFFSNKNQKSPA